MVRVGYGPGSRAMGTRDGQPDLRDGSELFLVLVEHAIPDEMVATSLSLEWDDVCMADGRLLSLSKMKQLRVSISIIYTVICRYTWVGNCSLEAP